jgi:hypothetical protein
VVRLLELAAYNKKMTTHRLDGRGRKMVTA